MVSSTLFVDLTTPSARPYPATTLVKHLIELIGTDVCGFRRNTQTAYRFVERARDLYDKINLLIADVEENATWDSYFRYLEAIDPLEEALLEFSPVADSEQADFLFDSASIDVCIAFIQRWEKNRSHVRSGLKKLWETDKFADILPKLEGDDEDFAAACNHDDNAFLCDLVTAIEEYVSNKENIEQFKKARTLVIDVMNTVVRLQNQVILTSQSSPPSNESSVLATKCVMISYGTLKLASYSHTHSTESLHLHSEKLWSANNELLNDAIEHIQNNKPLSKVQTAYNAFLDLLSEHTAIGLPESYHTLIKQVGRIGRPYHAQSLFLVSVCRVAAGHFGSSIPRNAQNLFALDRAFDQVARTLQCAAESVTVAVSQEGFSRLQRFELENYDNHDCTRLFRASANELIQCFKDIGLEDMDSDHEAMLQLAITQDRSRIVRFNTKMDKFNSSTESDSSKLVQLTVRVRRNYHNGVSVGNITMLVTTSTRLSAVAWTVTKHSNLTKELSCASLKFEYEIPESPGITRPIAPHVEIGQLSKNHESILYIVVVNGDAVV